MLLYKGNQGKSISVLGGKLSILVTGANLLQPNCDRQPLDKHGNKEQVAKELVVYSLSMLYRSMKPCRSLSIGLIRNLLFTIILQASHGPHTLVTSALTTIQSKKYASFKRLVKNYLNV